MKTLSLLSRFENDLEIGWDYAIEMLNNGLSYCLNGGYNLLISRIVDIYYEAYNLHDAENYDDGLVYEIRSNQINFLLKILETLRWEEENNQEQKKLNKFYEQLNKEYEKFNKEYEKRNQGERNEKI